MASVASGVHQFYLANRNGVATVFTGTKDAAIRAAARTGASVQGIGDASFYRLDAQTAHAIDRFERYGDTSGLTY